MAAQWFSHFLLKPFVSRVNRRRPMRRLRFWRSTIDVPNALRIAIAEDWDSLHGLHFSRRIARFALTPGAVDLDERREASKPIMQRRSDRRAIGREAVGCDLELARRCRVTDAFHESVRGVLIAFAHRDVENQLRVALNRNERVGVAKVLIVFRADTLLLLADEGPKFVALHVAYFDIVDLLSHDVLTLVASEPVRLRLRGFWPRSVFQH